MSTQNTHSPVAGSASTVARYADETNQVSDLTEAKIQRLLDEKFELYLTLEPGWDFYSAEPVSRKSLSDAQEFLSVRPKDIRLPFPQLGSDGIVGLYWDTKHGYVSVGFEGNGLLSYYARVHVDGEPCRKFYGDDYPYSSCWPKELTDILRKMRLGRREGHDRGE